jgi:Tol biopolymer transport system component
MSDVDLEVADSFERIFPVPAASADWDDVLERARGRRGYGGSRFGRKQSSARLRRGRHRRRVVLVAAASLVTVVGTASAFSTVRDLFFGERRIASAGTAIWSSDGRRIAFSTIACPQRCNGPIEINVMNADGSGERNLTREWRLEGAPPGPPWLSVWALSPDWRKVAFVQERGGRVRSSDIYVMNADGSGRRRLTRSPQNDGDLVWSPDGRRLVFVRIRGGRADIYLVGADGSAPRRLAHAIAFVPNPHSFSAGFDANPAWSPDGRRIAFVSNRDGNDDIFVVNVDGRGLRNLTRSRGNDRDPMWSPDGRKIAFRGERARPSELERVACRPRCRRDEIYVINADGSGLRQLTHNWRSDGVAAWSPDGRKILFLRSGWESVGASGDVYVMNADGTGQRNLTPSVTYPLATHTAPAWSPDGRRILFVSNRHDGNWFEVHVMNADGSGKRKLTQLKGRD